MPGVMEEDWQHAIEAACRGRHPSQVQTLILDEALRRPSGYLPSPSLFQTFSQLRILSIAHIRLVSLTNFPSLPHLHRLILCNNRISGGLDNLLRAGLANLRYLDLSENNIEFLEDLSPLAGFNFLVSLDLSECPVTRTPEYRPQLLAMLKSLRVLDKRNAQNGERVESEEEDFKEDDYEEDGFEEDDYEEDDIEEDDFEDDNEEEEEEEEEELANGNDDENNGFVFENGGFGALNGRHDIHQADGDEDGESEEVDVEDEYFDRIPQRQNPLDNIEGSGSESEEEVENHIGNGIGIQNGNGVVRDVEEESGDDNDDDDDGESGSFGSINGEIDALDNGEVQSEDEDVNSNSNNNDNNNNNNNNNNNEEEDSDNEEDYGAEYVVHPVEQADEGEASDFEPGEEDDYNDEDEDNGENEDVEDVADDQPASSCRKQKRSRDEGGFDSDQDGRQPKRT